MPTWKPSYPQHKPFKCGAYWHLRKSGLYLAVYDLIGAVTSGGKNEFFSSVQRISNYFNCDYETARRVVKGLRKLGWLDLTEKGNHRWVSHDKWILTRDAKEFCNSRELLPWQHETDPLVAKMFAACSGEVRFRADRVTLMRQYAQTADISDEKILAMFETTLAEAKASRASGDWKGTSSYTCLSTVMKYLKDAANAKKEALEVFQS
ncbi:MAG: hypothetical protein ACRD4X_01960 [Candidatus Acidiferrales bacterium]